MLLRMSGISRRTLSILSLGLLGIVAVAAVANAFGIGNWTAVGFPLAVVAVSLMHLFTTTSEPVRAGAARRRPQAVELVALVATSLAAVAASLAGAQQLHETFTWVLAGGVVAIVAVVLVRAFTSPAARTSTRD